MAIVMVIVKAKDFLISSIITLLMNLTDKKKVKILQICGTSKKKLRFCPKIFRTIYGKRVVQFSLFINVLGSSTM